MKILTRVVSGRFELLPFVYKRWCCGIDQQSVCIHNVKWLYCVCFSLTTLAVSVCSRYLTSFLTTLVLSHKCSQCTCTLFVPSWCCQINQSLYVHSICSKLVLSDKPVSVCAYYLLCPLTTLLLSDKPVPLSTLFAMPAHNVGAVR